MEIKRAVLGRLPMYLQYLLTVEQEKNPYISATTIAASLGLGEVQVRKDLQMVSGKGKPKVGYAIKELIAQLEEVLNTHQPIKAVIVGAGKLGQALLEYRGFADYGISILAAFDADSAKAGTLYSGKVIYPVTSLVEYCKKEGIKLGVITVPGYAAQMVCDKLVSAGVTGIWNFAPKQLSVPEGVMLEQEDLALSLAYLQAKMI